jgi:dihydrofolate synthase / folylpolyglutamate synthase
MNYSETLAYLLSHLPMYQRIGSAAFKKDLTNTLQLCEAAGNPQHKLKCIHVGGTNGKGSVSHIIASVLQQQGFKVGLYTSPHYKDFRERIKINGAYISETAVVEYVEKYQPLFETIQPSFFEMTVAMAFDYFASQKIDYAVIEVGLGGRLDSTNVITPLLSVITNISYDHTDMLGNTLEKIAFEKAGIIKENIPVIIGETHAESKPVFKKVAEEKNAPIHFADSIFQIVHSEIKNESHHITLRSMRSSDDYTIETDLQGNFQTLNVRTAFVALDFLRKNNFIPLSANSIYEGLKNVKNNTRFLGRFHVVQKEPLVIFDSAHNEAGLKALFDEINRFSFNKLHIVYGTVKDKELSKIFPLLPHNAQYYFCKADIPRGLDAGELQQQAFAYHLNSNTFSSVENAYKAALQNSLHDDLILATGSIFIVAEII